MGGSGGSRSADPIPAAALFAAIAGLLSFRFAYFDGLTAALAALLVVAWATSRPRRRGSWAGPIPPVAVGLAVVGLGWALFLLLPPPATALRGVVLGVTGLPLWLGFEPGAPRSATREAT